MTTTEQQTSIAAWLQALCPDELREEADAIEGELNDFFIGVEKVLGRISRFAEKVNTISEGAVEGLGTIGRCERGINHAGDAEDAIHALITDLSGLSGLLDALQGTSSLVHPDFVLSCPVPPEVEG
jgi:hypothetical protein